MVIAAAALVALAYSTRVHDDDLAAMRACVGVGLEMTRKAHRRVACGTMVDFKISEA
jgi:hypothetical protein